MWSLKSRDFKDRCHGLNYFQGFNNSLRPCHLHHGRRPTKQKALKAMFNSAELGTMIYRYYVVWRNKETAYFQFRLKSSGFHIGRGKPWLQLTPPNQGGCTLVLRPWSFFIHRLVYWFLMVFMNATHLGDAKNEQNTNYGIVYSKYF